MQWVDWVILAVLAGSLLGGMAQGFFRSICSLLGLILGIVLASWNYARLAVAFKPFVRIEAVADAIAFLLIAGIVMFLANLAGVMLKKMFRWMGLGCFDIVGGAIVGFVQGALVVMVSVLVIVAFFPQTAWLAEARLPQLFFGACHMSTHVSPAGFSDRVRKGLRLLERDSPQWLHPRHGAS